MCIFVRFNYIIKEDNRGFEEILYGIIKLKLPKLGYIIIIILALLFNNGFLQSLLLRIQMVQSIIEI